MTRILFVSTDVVSTRMAGPGIRAWELAHALAACHEVVLAVPHPCDLLSTAVTIHTYQPAADFAPLLARVDLVVGQGFVFELFPALLHHDLPLAIDLYDPLILESLDLYADAELAQAEAHHTRYQQLTDTQLRRGDFFFCATERQRDYWLGALTAIGRITPQIVRASDRDLRTLIDCVPSGIAAQPPATAPPVVRGVHPAVQKDAILLIWAGGLWDWFDPGMLVRAMAALRDEMPRLKLCFFAGARPNAGGSPFRTRTYTHTYDLAAQLGVLDTTVLFLDTWVPYAERGRYLREADIGVSAHQAGIETRMSFRTRLLDYLWARLPIVCSAGDSLAADIAAHNGGMLVAPGDLAGWISALRYAATDPAWRAACREQMEHLAWQYTWARVVQPLARFCAAPRRAAPPMPSPAAQLAELEQYARWLEAQAHAAHQELAAVKQGRVLRLLRLLQRGQSKA